MESVRLEFEPFIAERELALRTLATSLPYRVWNGIFAAGDRHLKKGPEVDVSAQRPEIGDHHAREMATKRPFC
jgi:hypothetical protein